jgi:hypothetical protein
MQQGVIQFKMDGAQQLPPCASHGSSSSFTEQPCTPTREHSFFHSSPFQPLLNFSQDWSADNSFDGCSPGAAAAVAAAHYSKAQDLSCTSSSSSLPASTNSESLHSNCDHCCNSSSNSSSSSDGCCSTDDDALLLQVQQEQQQGQHMQPVRFDGYQVLPGSSSSSKQKQRQRQRQRQGSGMVQLILVVMSCVCWLGMSSATILINKHIMVHLG